MKYNQQNKLLNIDSWRIAYAIICGVGGGSPKIYTGTFYFHSDHLGSIKYITDSEGNKVSETDYTPYGEQATTGPDIFQKKYTGQTDDNKTELLYYNARYYDPQIGRFITPDSIIPDMANSQAFNRYMYVEGNPVNFNDPTGNLPRIPYIGNGTTTDSEGRKNDIAFNLFRQEKRITGTHDKNGWGGENHWFTQALDQLVLHLTATVHDHFLNEYDKMSSSKQNVIKALCFISYPLWIAPAIPIVFLPKVSLDDFWGFAINVGSMPYAFLAGTTIGIINLHIWAANQGLAYSEKAWNKLKKSGKAITNAVSSTNKLVKNVTGSSTSIIKKVTNTVKKAVKKAKFW